MRTQPCEAGYGGTSGIAVDREAAQEVARVPEHPAPARHLAVDVPQAERRVAGRARRDVRRSSATLPPRTRNSTWRVLSTSTWSPPYRARGTPAAREPRPQGRRDDAGALEAVHLLERVARPPGRRRRRRRRVAQRVVELSEPLLERDDGGAVRADGEARRVDVRPHDAPHRRPARLRRARDDDPRRVQALVSTRRELAVDRHLHASGVRGPEHRDHLQRRADRPRAVRRTSSSGFTTIVRAHDGRARPTRSGTAA